MLVYQQSAQLKHGLLPTLLSSAVRFQILLRMKQTVGFDLYRSTIFEFFLPLGVEDLAADMVYLGLMRGCILN